MEQDFQIGNAESALTLPIQAGSVKKGGYVMIKDHPCRVTDYSTAKPGKHGSAKASIVGKDIFTNKTYEDSMPTATTIQQPIVKKTQYNILNITQDGFCFLENMNGQPKQDLKLPEDDAQLSDRIKSALKGDSNAQKLVTVMQACGMEKIIEFREKNN